VIRAIEATRIWIDRDQPGKNANTQLHQKLPTLRRRSDFFSDRGGKKNLFSKREADDGEEEEDFCS
jgi:hypothetical protein